MARHKKRSSPQNAESSPAGAPEAAAQETGSRIRFSHVWVAIFVFTVLFGYQRGKADRPVYKDAESSGNLIAYASRRANLVTPEWSGDRLAGGIVSLSCGVDSYRWDMQSGVLLTEKQYEERLRERVDAHVERIRSRSATPNLEESSLWTTYSANLADVSTEEMTEPGTPHEGTSATDLIELVAGGAGAYTATHTAQEAVQYLRFLRRTPFAKKLAGGAVLMATGAIGFKIGYGWASEDEPPCSTSDVLHMLQPPGIWPRVAEKLIAKYHLEIVRDQKGVITKISAESGDPLSLREVWTIRHSQTMYAQESGAKLESFRLSDAAFQDLAVSTALRHPREFLPAWDLAAVKINDHLYQSTKPSKLRLELSRALLESRLWSKDKDGSWTPEIWFFDRLAQEAFRNDIEHDNPFFWKTLRLFCAFQSDRVGS